MKLFVFPVRKSRHLPGGNFLTWPKAPSSAGSKSDLPNLLPQQAPEILMQMLAYNTLGGGNSGYQ